MEPVIRIEKLEKSFGNLKVLKGIDLEVMPGEVVCIIGASGSGKSTLLRCINLLEYADSGHIWFDGKDLMIDTSRFGVEGTAQLIADVVRQRWGQG